MAKGGEAKKEAKNEPERPVAALPERQERP
jgi:hypothetical protein